jgi:hypothetical protein
MRPEVIIILAEGTGKKIMRLLGIHTSRMEGSVFTLEIDLVHRTKD